MSHPDSLHSAHGRGVPQSHVRKFAELVHHRFDAQGFFINSFHIPLPLLQREAVGPRPFGAAQHGGEWGSTSWEMEVVTARTRFADMFRTFRWAVTGIFRRG